MSTSEDLTKLILKDLADVIASRKKALVEGGQIPASYVASLFAKGDDAILKKVAEEAAETMMAAKDLRHSIENQQKSDEMTKAFIGEVADLWFHTIVLLAQFNLRPEDVLSELKRREGVSGIAEKASRSAK